MVKRSSKRECMSHLHVFRITADVGRSTFLPFRWDSSPRHTNTHNLPHGRSKALLPSIAHLLWYRYLWQLLKCGCWWEKEGEEHQRCGLTLNWWRRSTIASFHEEGHMLAEAQLPLWYGAQVDCPWVNNADTQDRIHVKNLSHVERTPGFTMLL